MGEPAAEELVAKEHRLYVQNGAKEVFEVSPCTKSWELLQYGIDILYTPTPPPHNVNITIRPNLLRYLMSDQHNRWQMM